MGGWFDKCVRSKPVVHINTHIDIYTPTHLLLSLHPLHVVLLLQRHVLGLHVDDGLLEQAVGLLDVAGLHRVVQVEAGQGLVFA